VELHARKMIQFTRGGSVRYRFRKKGGHWRTDVTVLEMERAKKLIMTTTPDINAQDKKNIKEKYGKSKVTFI